MNTYEYTSQGLPDKYNPATYDDNYDMHQTLPPLIQLLLTHHPFRF